VQYTSLGRSGLQVSRLALGTMNFGELTGETASFQIMDAALDAGINFFDTADVYGGPQSPDMEKGFGISEEIIGRWLAQGGCRDRIVLATKLYQPMGTGPERSRPLRVSHPTGVRGQPSAAADRSSRPLSDAPRRSAHALGRDLAGDGAAGS
jgi:aryl-alcohol dehydrogenase-like predicted oxidoreductase